MGLERLPLACVVREDILRRGQHAGRKGIELLNETLTRKKRRKVGGEMERGKQGGGEVPRSD